MPIALVACRRESVPQDGAQGLSGVTDAFGSASASAPASARVRSRAAEASTRAGETTPDAGLSAIARRDGIVSVEPDPACADDTSTRNAGADAEAPRTQARRSSPESYAEPQGEAIERELENWKEFIAGTGRDDHRGAMVVVFHRDFADYDGLRQKLERISGTAKIVLRPACHSRKEISDARRVLDERGWHPQAKSVPMVWYFDARFSGFFVSVDESAPQVAKALEQRLGKLVRTRVENLVRNPRSPRL